MYAARGVGPQLEGQYPRQEVWIRSEIDRVTMRPIRKQGARHGSEPEAGSNLEDVTIFSSEYAL